MKNLTLIAALFAASALPLTASAQSNVINFKGKIVAAACTVNGSSVAGGGNATSATGTSNIEVNLGTVSASDIGTASTAFKGEAGVAAGAGSNITITFDCTKASTAGATGGPAKKFTVTFNPNGTGGTGYADKAVGTLALDKAAGAAKNVAIALFQDDQFINIGTANPVVKGEINGTTGSMNLRAMYVRSSSDPIEAGRADATLPFTLRYE